MNRKACGENYGKRIENDLSNQIRINLSTFPNEVITLAVALEEQKLCFWWKQKCLDLKS